ncbi:MAG: alkaline phosphatase D family protein [Verrucomicrobiota bacterium]
MILIIMMGNTTKSNLKQYFAAILVSLGLACATHAQPGSIEDLYEPGLAPFYHGVASGDPDADGFIIWTRITPYVELGQSLTVGWSVATDSRMKNIVAQGDFITDPSRDYTVKVDVGGLLSGQTYYYQFSYLKRCSIVGKTKTAPTEAVESLKFAVISCSNNEWGFFSGYQKIARRRDLDGVIHLGDYIYEYGDNDSYSSPEIRDEIVIFPANELLTLEDYRIRYANYRLDPNLREAHQQHPFIVVWDDHESANDAWVGGAENHDPATEGSWEARKAVSKQAYFEWMPIRENGDRIFRTLSYGPLLDLIMLDTRLEGREQQLTSIFDPALYSPNRTLLGAEQKEWLKGELENSNAQWKVIGNQVIFSEFNIGFAASILGIPSALVEGFFLDIWDGYRAERSELIDFIEAGPIMDVVFVTGDFHSSFAWEVTDFPADFPSSLPNYDPITAAGSVAVEFAVPSISAANFDENIDDAGAPNGTSAYLEFILNKPVNESGIFDPDEGFNFNPHLTYTDLDRHGYMILTVNENAVQADYYYMIDILVPTTRQTWGAGVVSFSGSNDLGLAPAPAPRKSVLDIPAPDKIFFKP